MSKSNRSALKYSALGIQPLHTVKERAGFIDRWDQRNVRRNRRRQPGIVGESSQALKATTQHCGHCGEGDEYLDGVNPLGSLTARELSPFVPHLGILALHIVGSCRYHEAEK